MFITAIDMVLKVRTELCLRPTLRPGERVWLLWVPGLRRPHGQGLECQRPEATNTERSHGLSDMTG